MAGATRTTATTPSSSVAGTTAWWPPRTSGRPGCGPWSSSGDRRSAVRPTTSELAPGARVPTLAHTVGRLRPSVVRDLDLKRHGLSLVGPEVRAFAPGTNGDADRAVERCGPDGRGPAGAVGRRRRGVPGVRRLVRSLSGFLGEIAGRTPPDIESPGIGDALAGLQLGRTFRGLGRDHGRTITRVLPMAIADFVAESFETDALQAAIAWRGVQYTSMGPWSAGTTAVLLADSAGNDGGAAGQTVFARGGPGRPGDSARGGGPGSRGRDPDRRRGHGRSRHVTAVRPASSWPTAKNSRRGPSSPASIRSAP